MADPLKHVAIPHVLPYQIIWSLSVEPFRRKQESQNWGTLGPRPLGCKAWMTSRNKLLHWWNEYQLRSQNVDSCCVAYSTSQCVSHHF